MSGKKLSILNRAKKTVPINTVIRWEFLFTSVTCFILLELYSVRVFRTLDGSFTYSWKILKVSLIFSLRSVSNDEDDSVASIHPQHVSGKDKRKVSKSIKSISYIVIPQNVLHYLLG